MKNLIFILLLFFCGIIQAQKAGDIFTSKTSSIPIEYVKTFDTRADTTQEAKFLVPFIKYEVTGTSTDFVEFSVKTLVSTAPSAKVLNYKIYKMSKTDYNRIKPVNQKDFLRFGALTLPVKLRSSDGEVNFETDLNANFAFAIRLKESFINDWDLSWQSGFGFGSTNLTSSNSAIEEGKDQKVQVLTGLTGLNLNFKGFQIGIYGGIDYINNQSEYDWKYNGNLFVSAGIGINIFGGNSNDDLQKEK